MTLIQFLLNMVQINFQYVTRTKVLQFRQNSKHQSKNKKSLHQQSLLRNDTDITSDDEDHTYTRIPKPDSSFTTDKT